MAVEKLGILGFYHLAKQDDYNLGIRTEGAHHFIGDTHVIVRNDDIIIPTKDKFIIGTPGIWKLLTKQNPQGNITEEDKNIYADLMLKTNALYKNNDPMNNKGKATATNPKWDTYLKSTWKNRNKITKGDGLIVIPSDPNALLKRFDLLLASKEAGHTGVRNELVSICDELKRMGAINNETYKKSNSIIKK